MPAVSKKQRRFWGLVRAVQKGEISPSEVSEKIVKAAKTVSVKTVRKFAKTKEKGLPISVSTRAIKRQKNENNS